MLKRTLTRFAKILAGVLALALLAIAGVLIYFGGQVSERETHSRAELAPGLGKYLSVADAGGKLDLFTLQLGPEDGLAVLLVHGPGAWSETWKQTMQQLANAGFRAIAIDLPPFGVSERPANADYSKVAQGRRIVGVLNALKVDKVILVGHSFGAGPAMEAALQIPDRVKGVVLVDAALGVAPANENLTQHASAGGLTSVVLAMPPVRDRVVATFLTNPSFTRKLLSMYVDNPASVTDEWVARYQWPLAAAGSNEAISRWLPEMLSPTLVAASEKPSTYQAAKMPIALIWGARDSITPVAQAQYLKSIAPSIHLEVLPGIGHIPQIEDALMFQAALLQEVGVMRTGASGQRP